jgi:cellulose biosynthesis protein BcsQ
MDFPGLYELMERFHRSNQLPAFLIGVVVTVLVGLFVVRLLRFKFGPSSSLEKIDRLERRIESLTSEKEHLLDEQRHANADAATAKVRNGELTGHLQSKNDTIAALTTECERLKADALAVHLTMQARSQRYRKARRLIEKLKSRLESIEAFTGRAWEIAVRQGAPSFQPLSQRRTPIFSLLNLKGGVGKTTIAANLAVAIAHEGWRVLLVDLDYQGSLSQIMLSNAEMQDLLNSRRLIHDALVDPANGLASFRKAIVRLDSLGQGGISLVAADEELLDVETVLSQRWHVKMTPDDVRYRLRAILHSREIAEQFDFILLDCPPRLTTACINALGASDYVLIPVLPNKASTEAVPRLLRWMRRLCLVVCPELSVMGVIGNKAKFFREAPVKKQQAEMSSLVKLCEDAWGLPVKFFPPLRMHDPLADVLPARDPKLRGAYLDLVHHLNKELPNYARSRSAGLSASLDSAIGSIRG